MTVTPDNLLADALNYIVNFGSTRFSRILNNVNEFIFSSEKITDYATLYSHIHGSKGQMNTGTREYNSNSYHRT